MSASGSPYWTTFSATLDTEPTALPSENTFPTTPSNQTTHHAHPNSLYSLIDLNTKTPFYKIINYIVSYPEQSTSGDLSGGRRQNQGAPALENLPEVVKTCSPDIRRKEID